MADITPGAGGATAPRLPHNEDGKAAPHHWALGTAAQSRQQQQTQPCPGATLQDLADSSTQLTSGRARTLCACRARWGGCSGEVQGEEVRHATHELPCCPPSLQSDLQVSCDLQGLGRAPPGITPHTALHPLGGDRAQWEAYSPHWPLSSSPSEEWCCACAFPESAGEGRQKWRVPIPASRQRHRTVTRLFFLLCNLSEEAAVLPGSRPPPEPVPKHAEPTPSEVGLVATQSHPQTWEKDGWVSRRPLLTEWSRL